jgi:uncharacterized protein
MSDSYKFNTAKKRYSPIVRVLLMVSGILAALLGFIGIFVPLLPTTPFLLLASWCFVRSSDRMNRLLLHNRYLGPYIRNYKSGRGITFRNKIYSLAFLWITLSTSFIFAPPYWWLRIGLIFIGTAVTIHILRFKTLKEN